MDGIVVRVQEIGTKGISLNCPDGIVTFRQIQWKSACSKRRCHDGVKWSSFGIGAMRFSQGYVIPDYLTKCI